MKKKITFGKRSVCYDLGLVQIPVLIAGERIGDLQRDTDCERGYDDEYKFVVKTHDGILHEHFGHLEVENGSHIYDANATVAKRELKKNLAPLIDAFVAEKCIIAYREQEAV